MKRIFMTLLIATAGFAIAMASGTSSSGTTVGPTPSNSSAGGAFSATRTMKCLVVELREPNLILLEDTKTGEQLAYRLADRIRLRVKNKADFGGRKRIEFADLAPGQEVRVSINPQRYEIVSLKVLRNSITDESS
jgi:hypothetical protein